MDYNRPYELIHPLREAAVHAAWTHWSLLGAPPPGLLKRDGHAIVDPEALVLATLAYDNAEKPLERAMRGWLANGLRLLSASRLARLTRDYPVRMIGQTARLAAEFVMMGDPRWKRLADTTVTHVRADKRLPGSIPLHVRDRAATMVRLRLAFGVGIKADALAYALGRMTRVSVRDISRHTGYQDRAVRRAIDDLVAARFLTAEATSPATYSIDWAHWVELLGLDRNLPPIWRNWQEIWAGVAHLMQWSEQAEAAHWPSHVAVSKLRDTIERIEPLLAGAISSDRPDWSKAPDDWPDECQRWVGALAEFMRAIT